MGDKLIHVANSSTTSIEIRLDDDIGLFTGLKRY